MTPFDRDKTLDQPSPRKLHNTTGISFLALSGELRNRIYEEVIKGLGIHSKVVTPILPCCRVSSNQLPKITMKSIVSSCRLGQVSRTVREEFLSMLWRHFDFYYHSCIFCISEESPEVPGEIEDLQSIAPMLRRHVTNLVFFIHLDQDVPSKFSILANILLAVEFKGTLTIDGQKSRVIAIEEGLELIRLTGAYERDTMAAVKSIEKQIDRRPLDDQHDLSTSALIRRDAESTDAPPPSTIPPPPKRPRTSLPAAVPSTGPTSATSATSLIPTPLSLIQRSFASAQTRTYTRLSLAEIQRLPVDTVAAYAHALQRALDITAHGFNEKLRDQEIAQEAAEELRKVSNAVYTLLNVPVQDLEREVERVAEMAYDVSNDLDNPDLEDLERDQVLSRLDYKARYGDSLYKTAAALAPLGRWHDEREVRWMRSRVCMNVLEQMKWWPEFRNKTQTGRWRYYGSPCSRRLLLEMLGLGNFRGAQWAPGPLQQQDDSDDDAGQWRCKSLPLAKWKEVMGDLEKEVS